MIAKYQCQMWHILSIFFVLFFPVENSFSEQKKEEALEQDNDGIVAYSKRMQQFYELNKGEQWRDVTEQVLSSPDTSRESKESIKTYERRIIVFRYPSEGLSIKGFFSYTPYPNHHPLLILYRWGNENFALMNPGVVYATYKNYTVISSTLRGGVSDGNDEFGGGDVNDMKNMIEFIPKLSKELGIKLHPSCVFMMGPSRGGLEMFLTLSRFPELQKRVNKVVALSAALDLHSLIHDRPNDMKKMLQNHFGLQDGAKGEAWIAKRDPLNAVPLLNKSLPILIIQGTDDNRISLDEGVNMVKALKKNGNEVDYWEVPKGNHVLMNNPHIMSDIARWLESPCSCLSVHLPRQKEE